VRILRVTWEEFELEDGSVFPIIPPLTEDLTVEEFQTHYDYASTVVRRSEKTRCDDSNLAKLGSKRED